VTAATPGRNTMRAGAGAAKPHAVLRVLAERARG